MKIIFRISVVCCALLCTVSKARAQRNPNVQASDISGPPVTSGEIAGGIFAPSPGPVATLANATVQAAVVGAMTSVSAMLSAGTMTTLGGVAISPAVQAQLLAVLTSNSPTTGPAAKLADAINSAGAGAPAAVQALVTSLSGLGMNPAQLPTAVGEFNNLVQVASPAFLANPPQEFLAIQAVLNALVTAAAAAK
jgi:hypothetical protein